MCLDSELARKSGWEDVTENDCGQLVGTNPETGRTCFIPKPSQDPEELLALVQNITSMGAVLKVQSNHNDNTFEVLLESNTLWAKGTAHTLPEAICSAFARYLTEEAKHGRSLVSSRTTSN